MSRRQPTTTTTSAMVWHRSNGQMPVRDAGGNAGVTRGRAPDGTPHCPLGDGHDQDGGCCRETLRQLHCGKRHVHCCKGVRQQKMRMGVDDTGYSEEPTYSDDGGRANDTTRDVQ